MATFWSRHLPSIWHTLTHFLVTCSKRKSLRITEHLSAVSFYVCSDHSFCITFTDSPVFFHVNSHIFSSAFNLIPAPLCHTDFPPLMLLCFPQLHSIHYTDLVTFKYVLFIQSPIRYLCCTYLSLYPCGTPFPFIHLEHFHPSLPVKLHLFSKAFLTILMHIDCIFLCVCLPYKLWPSFIAPIKCQAHLLHSLQLHKVIIVILILWKETKGQKG